MPKAEEKKADVQESKPGLVSRLFKAISNFLFGSSSATDKVEEKKETTERKEGQRSNRNRRNRNDQRRRSPRDNRSESRSDNREEKRDIKRDNKRKPQQRDEASSEGKVATERKPQNRKPKQDRRSKVDDVKATKVAEEGLKLAADAEQTEKPNRTEEKAAKVKERRQRRQLTKQVRVKDQKAQAEAQEVVKEAKAEVVAEAVEQNVEAPAQEAEQGKQRRNRRSPRHLRASGQRRRRGRDRRPNPFRLRKGGVASPEMAMGKVMPSYGIIKPAAKSKPKTEQVAVEAVESQVVLGGFACPEMAMGKVIIRHDELTVEPAKTEIAKPIETPETPVEVVEKVEKVEAPIVEVEQAEEVAIAKTQVTTSVATQAMTETISENAAPVFKGQASSPMTKASGPVEMKEIAVVAAPFREERYQPKGAGSQVAKNQASAAMTKPVGF